jgi:hypothetical protein
MIASRSSGERAERGGTTRIGHFLTINTPFPPFTAFWRLSWRRPLRDVV